MGSVRRPRDAVDFDRLEELYPPAPQYFDTAWLDDPATIEAYAEDRRRMGRHLGLQPDRFQRLRNGDEIFPAMLTAIREATNTIDLLTFVYGTGEVAREFAETLAGRARAGLRVRVLLDDLVGGEVDDGDAAGPARHVEGVGATVDHVQLLAVARRVQAVGATPGL